LVTSSQQDLAGPPGTSSFPRAASGDQEGDFPQDIRFPLRPLLLRAWRWLDWVIRSKGVCRVSLRVTSGKLDIQPGSISCNLHDGETVLRCTIAIEVLRDLADHSMLNWSTDVQAFGLLIPEIERLAYIKYRLRRLEENGDLLLGTVDLLRYGFSRPRKMEGILAKPGWRIAAE
jgi:hypothetical protein